MVGLSAQAATPATKTPPPAPLFKATLDKARKSVAPYLKQRPDVPVPKDAGGGYTHERHKDNYRVIREAGMLYAFTGERRYADLVRDVLFAYADLYPGLKPHPIEAAPQKGKLFWQSLNDAVWLVEAIQGYAEVRSVLTPADRQRIEANVFRPMCAFSMVDSAKTFERIHNHATWAVAGVGMTGYVINEPAYVKAALYGLKGDGKTGFLRQIDELFSPDGYYTEGPYYQRYALQPFEVFAGSIERYDPAKKIFDYRDGMLVKAVYALIDLSYEGKFFPLNDAIVDKGIDSPELIQALAIVYARNKDPQLLSVSTAQGTVAFTREGALVAADIAAGKSKPFNYKSQLFRDGAKGDEGGVAVIRSGKGNRAQALVFKATAQGMGHGHFDRLSYIFYDAKREAVADYGAARYLNVEAKKGGRYLAENETWAKQSIAHNTLVVDETSQFNADVDAAQPVPTTFLTFATKDGVQFASARLDKAYGEVTIWRAVMVVERPELGRPVVIDLVRARGQSAHRYDLPLHYKGVFLDASTKFKASTTGLAPLGTKNGYQHLWKKAEAAVPEGGQRLSWFNRDRFYSLNYDAPGVSKAFLTELGANDPDDNLRPERAVILRADNARDFNSVSVLEAYGDYDPAQESVRDILPSVTGVRLHQDGANDLIILTLKTGQTLAIGVTWDGEDQNSVTLDGKTRTWRGAFGVTG
ncbi:hypothetical protein AEYBE204_14360 [Asticcacaulis sp. YBE204]|nr:hypothetical protein AEYBE204_14360 [Asticcacaulis sp. YBE204]